MMMSQLTRKTLAHQLFNRSSQFSSMVSSPPSLLRYSLSSKQRTYLGVAGGLVLAGLHSATGSQNDFFDYRFIANKSQDDLATFYGGEEFMELFCIFPFVGSLMMRNGSFDEKGNVLTQGFPGTLKVSMVFSEDKDEQTGEIEWFNKRERFRNIFMGWTMWDMVINFGFRTRDDGKVEVYHHGEYFHGNLPVVSQIMKGVFTVHARWLAWSTEHHVNHYAFADTDEGEELEEKSRQNMPLFLLTHYAWTDLMAMVLGRESRTPSFLIKGASKTDDEEALPVHNKLTKLRISHDIAVDRITTQSILTKHETKNMDEVSQVMLADHGPNDNFARKDSNHAYGAATHAARLRQLTRSNTLRQQEEMIKNRNSEKPNYLPSDNQQNATQSPLCEVPGLRRLTRVNTVATAGGQ